MTNDESKHTELNAPERGPKQSLTLEQAKAFAQGALKEASAPQLVSSRCVDGRNPQESAATAMAGGDAGLLSIGLALANQLRAQGKSALTDDAVLRAVFATLGSGDMEVGKRAFHSHTDTHNKGNFDGCGHCKLMKKSPVLYGMTDGQATFLEAIQRQLKTEGVEPVRLAGEHEERAVFDVVYVNNLNDKQALTPEEMDASGFRHWTFNAQTTMPGDTDASQAFVHHRSLTAKRLRDFGRQIISQIPALGLSEQDLLSQLTNIEQEQLTLTVTQLAKNKPVYVVYVDAKTGEHKIAAAS